ncbi:MAG: metallopeptidase family protein [Dehalococcoidaceae bacterium]|nr:metallopeptidase family protein [Dehalococcoidaceae bacterium]
MKREIFEELVAEALEQLPAEFVQIVDNLDVCVEDQPSRSQLSSLGMKPGEILLGLYEGIPLTERGHFYGMVPPDKITVFQKTIERKCRHEPDKIIQEIGRVVRHEIAHHFGLTDARLEELENGLD